MSSGAKTCYPGALLRGNEPNFFGLLPAFEGLSLSPGGLMTKIRNTALDSLKFNQKMCILLY
jgi:hypothetical protein